jgi:hypothetical protein
VNLPSTTVIWQFIYTNSIAVAFGVILLAALLLAIISALGRQRATEASPKKQPTKPKKRKPRDVYDIFPE